MNINIKNKVEINNIGVFKIGINIEYQILISILDWINELSISFWSPINELICTSAHLSPIVKDSFKLCNIKNIKKLIKEINLIIFIFWYSFHICFLYYHNLGVLVC